MDYGIANERGRVPGDEVRQILKLAADSGIDTIDTAIAYGDSEATLGTLDLSDFHLVTKLPTLPDDEPDVPGWVERHTLASCERLGINRVHGLLLHRAEDVHGPRGSQLVLALKDVRERGLTDGVGVSIYAPSQLEGIDLEDLDLIQAPLNVFDRRLIELGALSDLNDAGVRVYVRSALLQGVLVMNPDAVPPRLAGLRAPITRFREWAAAREVSPLAAALGHLFAVPGIYRIVLGIDGIDQLHDALAAEALGTGAAPAELAVDDPGLIDPRRWW
jgi:aryl-alcohol dehydrogenase-like predicted oxidoreductase